MALLRIINEAYKGITLKPHYYVYSADKHIAYKQQQYFESGTYGTSFKEDFAKLLGTNEGYLRFTNIKKISQNMYGSNLDTSPYYLWVSAGKGRDLEATDVVPVASTLSLHYDFYSRDGAEDEVSIGFEYSYDNVTWQSSTLKVRFPAFVNVFTHYFGPEFNLKRPYS